MRRVLAATLACYLAGCAVSAETTGGQFNQIKPGMTREEVVGSLGEPAQTKLVNSAPSEDLYACDEQGQIMVVRNSQFVFLAEGLLFPLALVDFVKLNNLVKQGRHCAVHYDQGMVVSTGGPNNGVVFAK